MEEAVQFETRQNPWWLLLLGGILNIIVGILLLANPASAAILVWVLGLYWFIQGIFIIIGMFVDHSAWGWKLFSGILGIIAGILVMRSFVQAPFLTAFVITHIAVLLLGIQGLISGAIMLVMAFKGGGWGMAILGVVSIIFGIILILAFGNVGTVAVFIWAVGVVAVAGGLVQIFQAFRQRQE